MTPREADIRRRIIIPDHRVTGHISPNDVRAYLRATGWSFADTSGHFRRYKGAKRQSQQSPLDDASQSELVNIIHDLAWHERRSMGEVLRDIEAMAGTPSMKTRLTRDDLSEIAEGIPALRELPGVRPWSAKRLARSVEKFRSRAQNEDDRFSLAHLDGAIRVLVEVDRRIAATLRRRQ
ncbi:hypothetical protein [Sorangium sp. So ce861]|uniref:hypothetical protein n=1 Tax=Sorangium sp. So ce861 TaxID=3133323 RepID=UPI003F6452CA